jgi:MYXO-CTERM domain-containing protein
MKRILFPLLGGLALAASGLAQTPDTSTNPNRYTDSRGNVYTDTRGYTETRAGNAGLWGLLGLTGLLGLRRRSTIVQDRDMYTTEQRHRAA